MKGFIARAGFAMAGGLLAAATVATTGFGFLPPRHGRVVPGVDYGALVNGTSSSPTIHVGCVGPLQPGEKGHPVGGNTVEVFRPEVLQVPGNTGSAATMIIVHFDDPSTDVVLRRFGSPRAIPPSLNLPCTGTGQVTFTPEATSPTAKSVTITVQYGPAPSHAGTVSPLH
ncbi:MAG TPA: hypothetical protein VG076_14050 [Acidimicrobiales bacterium]|nr:hypothetical protein [Acidimicrobiales bacterium]